MNLRKLSESFSLTVKLTAIIVIIGALLLVVLVRFHTETLRSDFQDQMIQRLEQEAKNDRQNLHRQIKMHEQAAKTFVALKSFQDFVVSDEWGSNDGGIKTHSSPPEWFPPTAVIRLFSPLRFAVLIDANGKVREAYSPPPYFIPEEILKISTFLIAISHGQSYLTLFDNTPYIISSKEVRDDKNGLLATLVLATPIDDYFLTKLLETSTPGHEVALIGTKDTQNVISSSNNVSMPPGAPISEVNRKYLITGKAFFDYGSSDLEFRFASMIPREQVNIMTETALRSSRSLDLLLVGIYIAVFMVAIIYITRNIRKLTAHVISFQGKMLGAKSNLTTSGDELVILERHFHVLMDEVIQSQTQVRQEAYEQTHLIVRNAFDAVVAMNEFGAVTTWNPAAEKLFGWTSEEIMNSRLSEKIIPPEDRFMFNEGFRKFIDSEDDTIFGKPQERIVISKNGSLLQVEATFTHALTKEGHTFIGTLRDITGRKQLEEQLLQSQKMESIGRLAGGIAHDFNNILTAVLGYTELMLMDMDKKDPNRNYVQIIHDAGHSAADLVSKLLVFSRKQITDISVLCLNDKIKNMEKILGRLLGEDIVMEFNLQKGLWSVKADSTQIEQIIMNLAVNARDAIGGNGQLYIETCNVELDSDYIKSHFDLLPGKYVMMAVSDTGHGMSEEQKLHIFEPFYSTKEVGKGTGLGLATVFGIIKQSDGDIQVYSEVGVGTTFKLYFPMVEGNVRHEDIVEEVNELSGTETILLIEDDSDVRKLATESLSSYGYTVIEADNGEDALNLHTKYHGQIHMVLTDVVMPKMNGTEVADKLSDIYPGIKVLFMSGYTENAIVHHGILDKGINFIPKPITPVRLAKAVKKVLSE